MDDEKYICVANLYTVLLQKDFKVDANGARAFMGHFLCGVETRAMEPGGGAQAIWDGWSQCQKFLDDGVGA